MLPGAEDELDELGPEEAVEELLARMLEYRRYRDAAATLAERFEAAARLPLPLGAAAAGAAPGRRSTPPPPSTTRSSSAPRSATC